MYNKFIPASMPSRDKDCACVPGYDDTTFTTSRHVIQQYDSDTGNMSAMFTVEMTDIGEVMLKTFDRDGRIVQTNISYDTAFKLQTAISDAMDELEEYMGINV